ncbi:TonB-dependent receptor [Nitrosomonas sp.]|uniref:TonB-dependent receptor n=1 Tax=Nitrosomonas sp. TaxID=42353 RepID=UPI0025F05043|nr:TonB-dependent siderophore receptor [Nitrosomonas sp.]
MYKIYSVWAGIILLVCNEAIAQPNSTKTDGENIPSVRMKEITVSGKAIATPNGRLLLDTPTTTGSRLGLTPRETPASIHIIDRATIESRGAQTTQQALERSPGVIVSDQPGSAGTVCMRGFCGAQITQLFNGITVQYDVIAARPIDNWLTERVEVLGGPSSFLYGQGAVGGSVNYISRTANREQQGHEALVLLGSWLNRRAAYGYNGRIGDTNNWLQVHAGYKGSNGYVDKTQHNSGVFSFSLLSDLTNRISNTVAVEYQKEAREAYWGTPLLNPVTAGKYDPETRFKNYNADNSVFDQQVIWVRDILDFRLSEATQARNTFYWYDADRQYKNVEVYRWNAANTLINRSASFATDHKQNLIGNRLELSHQQSLFGFPTKWLAGTDIAFNDQTRFPSTESGLAVDTIDPYNFTVGSYYDNPRASGPIKDRRNKLFTVAGYAENRLTLLPGLNLVSGIRVDHIELDSRKYTLPTATEPASFSRDWTPVTWRAGFVYDITDNVNFYTQYSTAASPPGSILTTSNFSSVRDFGMSTGKQIEGGMKFDFWEKRGTATIAGYYLQRKNISTRDPNNPINTIPIGAQSSRGVEVNLGVRLSTQWSFQGNMAYVDARYDDFNELVSGHIVSRKGNRPENIAKWVANTWLSWDFHPDFQWMLSTRYVGDRYANAANTIPVKSHVRLDTQIAWRAHRNAKIIGRVMNLTDTDYIEWATSTPMYLIGAPRSYEVAVKLDF